MSRDEKVIFGLMAEMLDTQTTRKRGKYLFGLDTQSARYES